jgi:hypothetical protein
MVVPIDKDISKGFSDYYIKQKFDETLRLIEKAILQELLKNDIDTIKSIEDLENIPSKLNEINVDYYKISVLAYIKDQSILEKIKAPIDNIENKAKRMLLELYLQSFI